MTGFELTDAQSNDGLRKPAKRIQRLAIAIAEGRAKAKHHAKLATQMDLFKSRQRQWPLANQTPRGPLQPSAPQLPQVQPAAQSQAPAPPPPPAPAAADPVTNTTSGLTTAMLADIVQAVASAVARSGGTVSSVLESDSNGFRFSRQEPR
jgi:hypothetical protein